MGSFCFGRLGRNGTSGASGSSLRLLGASRVVDGEFSAGRKLSNARSVKTYQGPVAWTPHRVRCLQAVWLVSKSSSPPATVVDVEAYDVYLAAPLFNDAEKAFNEQLALKLEGMGLHVFLPQRDGLEFAALEGSSPDERNRRIFALDISTVEASSTIVAVLDGRVPDEGVCVEVATGREYSKLTGRSKLILGLKSDKRTWLPEASLNPMITGTLDRLFDSEASLLAFMKDNLTKIVSVRES